MKVIRNKLDKRHAPTVQRIAEMFSDTFREAAMEEEDVLRVGRRRLKFLGSGSFSSVYALDDKWAVRIEWNNRNCYRDWAEFCMKARNKHLPKIAYHALVSDYDSKKDFAITVVERLDKVPADFLYDDPWDDDCESIERIVNGNRKAKILGPAKKHVSMASLRRLSKTVEKNALYVNDIHTGNIMLRKCGTLVLTDPLH